MMFNRYPRSEVYRELYKRYYSGRDVQELLALLAPLTGMTVLDLCGGEGQLTFNALQKGATAAVMVEEEPLMVSPTIGLNPRVRILYDDVRRALKHLGANKLKFDRVGCRQGVNYWLDQQSAGLLADVMPSGGVFAFNTFNRQPPTTPRVLEYMLEGKSFVEVSWLVGEVVHHLQVREGLAPHCTLFQWLPPAKLQTILEPYFAVLETRDERSSLYRCVRK